MNKQTVEWISPSERLPESLEPVLFVEKGNFKEETVVGCYDADYNCWAILEFGYNQRRAIPTGNIRRWMPKPMPPKQCHAGGTQHE